jgi:hypothetical protein
MHARNRAARACHGSPQSSSCCTSCDKPNKCHFMWQPKTRGSDHCRSSPRCKKCDRLVFTRLQALGLGARALDRTVACMQEFMIPLLLRFNGEVITESGNLLYHFPDLQKQARKSRKEVWRRSADASIGTKKGAQEEREPPYIVTEGALSWHPATSGSVLPFSSETARFVGGLLERHGWKRIK